MLMKEKHPPIDYVFTWAGMGDPHDQRQRFNGELQYVIRSLWKHVRWINHVYVLVNTNVLAAWEGWSWLKDPAVSYAWVTFIDRCTLFDTPAHCPTNVGYGADSVTHRIRGLSNLYIASDDDVFLARDLAPSYFFRKRVRSCTTGVCSEWVPICKEIKHNPPYTLYDGNPTPPANVKYPPRKWQMFSHTPSPLRRDLFFAFEKEFPGWLDYVQSHNKTRFGETHPQWGLIEDVNMAFYQWMSERSPPQVIDGYAAGEMRQHQWSINKHDVPAADLAEQLDVFAKRIEAARARGHGQAGIDWADDDEFATFNMNDEYSSNDDLRAAQLLQVRNFWERLYPKPWFERNGTYLYNTNKEIVKP